MNRKEIILAGGSAKRLYPVMKIISTIENRLGLKVACLEEVGFRHGWISTSNLDNLAKPLLKNQYGQYLIKILSE